MTVAEYIGLQRKEGLDRFHPRIGITIELFQKRRCDILCEENPFITNIHIKRYRAGGMTWRMNPPEQVFADLEFPFIAGKLRIHEERLKVDIETKCSRKPCVCPFDDRRVKGMHDEL